MKIDIKNIDDITINQYVKLLNIFETKEENFDRDIEIVSMLTDLEIDELKSIPYSSIKEILSKIEEIISKKPDDKVGKDIKIEKTTYLFDSNLHNITTGQFTDLYGFTKDEDTLIKNLHLICAILFRKKVKGKIEKYTNVGLFERADIFKNKMSIITAQNAAFFFLNIKIKLLEETLRYLEKQLKSKTLK